MLLRDLAQARARDQGWAAIPDHPSLRAVEESIVGTAASGPQPESIRELDARIARYAGEYAAMSQRPPRGVSAPVLDHTGRVVLALTVQRLPAMDRDELERCRRDLVAAGVQLTEAISGVHPKRSD